VTLDEVDSGFYFANGRHSPSNENYLTGLFTTEQRSFFVFDRSSVRDTITSATLRLFNPEVTQVLHGYVSPDATEILNFYDVTTSAADVRGNTAGLAGFADLGSGSLYGTRIVSASDNGTIIEIALNNSALAALNAGTSLFIIGGALGSIGGPSDQYVFGFSMAPFVADHTRQLILVVPEPSTAAFFALGTLLLVCGSCKFRSNWSIDSCRSFIDGVRGSYSRHSSPRFLIRSVTGRRFRWRFSPCATRSESFTAPCSTRN
jgi:hypothetical protein